MISLRDLCYLSWKQTFRQRTEFIGMGNFHNEYSEQGSLLADPSKNESSPFCSNVSLPPSPFGSRCLMTCSPLLVFWGNTPLGQYDFHFSMLLHVCPTEVFVCIQKRRNRVALKMAMLCSSLHSLFPLSHWFCACW